MDLKGINNRWLLPPLLFEEEEEGDFLEAFLSSLSFINSAAFEYAAAVFGSDSKAPGIALVADTGSLEIILRAGTEGGEDEGGEGRGDEGEGAEEKKLGLNLAEGEVGPLLSTLRAPGSDEMINRCMFPFSITRGWSDPPLSSLPRSV